MFNEIIYVNLIDRNLLLGVQLQWQRVEYPVIEANELALRSREMRKFKVTQKFIRKIRLHYLEVRHR